MLPYSLEQSPFASTVAALYGLYQENFFCIFSRVDFLVLILIHDQAEFVTAFVGSFDWRFVRSCPSATSTATHYIFSYNKSIFI